VCATGLLLASRAQGQECVEEYSPKIISDSLEIAEKAFSDLDVDGFRLATDLAASKLPCVRQEISRQLSAEYHRFVGLRAFVDREQAKAVSAFAAARTIEPDYQFPETFIPSGNPVMNSYLALDVSIDEWSELVQPTSGKIQFDGQAAGQRSTRFPHVYQYFDAAGSVQDTRYVFPEERLPSYPGAVVLSVEPVASTVGPIPKSGAVPHKGLLIGAGVGALTAVVLYGAASSNNNAYNSVDVDDEEELNRLRRSTNSKVIASASLATVSVGLGASAFLVARW
jgi:hypothetical protein